MYFLPSHKRNKFLLGEGGAYLNPYTSGLNIVFIFQETRHGRGLWITSQKCNKLELYWAST
jgi:hypothetical protein